MKSLVQTPDYGLHGYIAKAKRHKIFVITLMLGCLAGSSASAQLLHRYDFNSVNDTVGTANGTLEGNATITGGTLNTTGIGGGLSGGVPLNGFSLPASAVTGITNAFSIETWFAVNYVNGGYSSLFAFSDGTTANYVLGTPARGGYPYPSGVAIIGGDGNDGPGDQEAGGIYLDNGGYHDMIITYDGTNVTYYLDGGLAPNDPIASVSPTFVDPGLNLSTMTYVGVNGGSPWGDNTCNGSTYDFRLYGQALTPAQIASIYALGSDASNSAISNAIVPPTAFVWNGAGANNNWSTALNWIGGTAPGTSGNSVTFAGSTSLTPNLDTAYSVTGLTFSNNASSFTFGTANGSALTLAGNLVNNSPNTQTFNVPVSLNVASSLSAASGSLVVNSNITLGSSGTLTLAGNSNFNLNGNVLGSGIFTMNGAGALTVAGSTLSAGAVSFNNGSTVISNTVVTGTGGTTYVGYLTATSAVSEVGGTFNDGAEIRVGGSDQNGSSIIGSGSLTISNATVNASALTVARGNYLNNTESGTVTLNSGSTFTSTNDVILQFAGMGLGQLAINGGNFIIGPTALHWLMVGYFDSGEGEINLTNGNIFMENSSAIKMCRSGNTGANVINQVGGAVTFYSDAGVTIGGTGNLDLNYGGGASSSSAYNLNGGILTVPQIMASSTSGSGVFNFNGGTLKPTASSATFMQGLSSANVMAGGAIIDTTNYNITIGQTLSDGGGGNLTKIGAGTLTLAGGYNYSGPTVVRAGALSLDAAQTSGGGNLSVTNAALSLSLNGGASSLSVATLAFGGTNALNFNYGTVSGTPITAISASGVNVSGTNTINITGQGLIVGDYPLIYTGSSMPTNHFALGTLPTGVVAVLINSGSSLDLLITAAGQNLTWYGADSLGNTLTNWNINTSSNWNFGNALYLQYAGNSYGDNVTFNDNVYPGNTGINLAVRVVPTSVLFGSTSQAYSLTGKGGIDGVTSVLITNGGSLYLGTSNNFTGGTVVGGGTLTITNDDALGTNSGLLTLIGGNLELAGSTTSTRPITMPVATSVEVDANAAAQLNGVVSGAGALTTTGGGTLTLGGNNTYAGPTSLSAGTLNLSGTLTNTSVTVANVSGNNAVLDISGILNVSSLFIANNGGAAGAVYQTGGSATVVGGGGDCLDIGNLSSAFGYYKITGGIVTANGIAVGGENNNGTGLSGTGGDGVMEVNGGTVTNVGWMVMARGASGETGILNIFNGYVTYAGGGLVCNWGSGQVSIINMMGGTLTSSSVGIGLGSAGNTGILNLNGGLTGASVVGGNFGGTFGQVNFNGGTLKAIAGSANFVAVTSAAIYTNGATIDDGGYAVTVKQPLLAPAGYGVSSISLSSGGSGYIAPPIVTISGGAGSNATAIATMSGGVITGVTVTSPGSGYLVSDAGNLSVSFSEGGVSAVAPTVNVISLVSNTSGGLAKNGVGTLTLDGVNTYTGPTKINAGTLAGTGTVAGALTNSATLAPGDAGAGALTVNGNITLTTGSTNTFAVNGTTPANASVIAGGAVNYGGVLNIVANGTFTSGQTFQLFSGTGAVNTGNFARIVGTPGGGLGFAFTNGVLSVVSGGIASNPTNITFSVSGSTMSLSWPTDHLGWILQQQTNSLSAGLGTNWVDNFGTTNVTSTNITINPSTPTAFYRLRHP